MILQGFPTAAVSDLVNKTKRGTVSDIAGSMVSAPVSLALIMAMIASVHWRGAGAEKASLQAADSDDDEIIGSAMFAFGMLSRPSPQKKLCAESPIQETQRKKIKF